MVCAHSETQCRKVDFSQLIQLALSQRHDHSPSTIFEGRHLQQKVENRLVHKGSPTHSLSLRLP